MLEPEFVTFQWSDGCVDLVNAPIFADTSDFKGIHLAVADLSQDFARVTGGKASPIRALDSDDDLQSECAIIVGSLQSPTIQRLEREEKLDVSEIRGRWECFLTIVVERPFPGCKTALVIAGSDKRGAIFGTYTLSEQIGVSPWYWWADVTTKRNTQIFAKPIRTRHGEPSVKYRGIFINDEAPALTGWVNENYGQVYGAEFYKKVFELLLRLKANFMWPAMWPGYPNPGNSFFADDPLNQKIADEYGIVISTSHHEPMQRAMNEWFADNPDGSWSWVKNKEKIREFFEEGIKRAKDYESYITLGMRGDGDREMAVDDPPAVLRDVLEHQRSIIEETYGKETGVKQLMALYKEVQEYYEDGFIIPKDVTLLFADDNFGTIRRLPSELERCRPGGSGIYYHLEYVGEPRSYKWLNSNSLGKVWHQLNQAHSRGADQIWIFNVGDIKPLELPITFVMALAWNIGSVPAAGLVEFTTAYARREFDAKFSGEISSLLLGHDRLVALRKHEHIEAETFSIVNYREADQIMESWRDLLTRAEKIYGLVSNEEKPSYFQLVLHPIKASYVYNALRNAQAKNNLYAKQRRNTTNKVAQEVLNLFEDDFNLSEEYHAILNGKWNHMMRQPHYGFSATWHAPSRDMISGLCYVQTRQDSSPIVGQMGVTVEGTEGVRPGLTNEESDRTHPSRRDLVPGVTLPPMSPYGPPSRYFEIYSRGSKDLVWELEAAHSWVLLDRSSGELRAAGPDGRIEVSISWEAVPTDFDGVALISIRSDAGDFEQVHLPVSNKQVASNFKGFVESDGYVSMEAAHYTAPREPSSPLSVQTAYRTLPFLGRTGAGGVELARMPGNKLEEPIPFLEYSFYIFAETPMVFVLLYFNMTLDTDPTNALTYDVSLNDRPYTTHRLAEVPKKPGELPPDWLAAVQDCVWIRKHDLGTIGEGPHTLKFRAGAQNVILEKLVVETSGLRKSYLGPPESKFIEC